jgi:membrane protease YdiL (CAAX protease family)
MDSRYSLEVAKYRKKDAIIALCVYAALIIFTLISNAILSVDGRIAALVTIAIIVAIALIRKQGITSLGLRKENLGLSLRLGLLFAIIPIILSGILPGLLNGWELNNFGRMMNMLLFVFIMAAWEDIFFIGFLQTRLYGLIKNDGWAVNAGAALFALMHIPIGLAESGMGFIGIEVVVYLIGTFFYHRSFVLIFKRYHSLFAVTLLHIAVNWSYMHMWRLDAEGLEISTMWSTITAVILIVAIHIWDWRIRRRAVKTLAEQTQ